MERGLRGVGAELRLQAHSTGALRNLKTVANCTRSLQTRMPDGIQTGFVPEGWHTRFFVGLAPRKVVIYGQPKSQWPQVNL